MLCTLELEFPDSTPQSWSSTIRTHRRYGNALSWSRYVERASAGAKAWRKTQKICKQNTLICYISQEYGISILKQIVDIIHSPYTFGFICKPLLISKIINRTEVPWHESVAPNSSNMSSSSKVWKPLVDVSMKQHRMNEKLSPHMIGIIYGCWNSRGMSPHAEHLHNALSSLNGYKIEIKKQKLDEE